MGDSYWFDESTEMTEEEWNKLLSYFQENKEFDSSTHIGTNIKSE